MDLVIVTEAADLFDAFRKARRSRLLPAPRRETLAGLRRLLREAAPADSPRAETARLIYLDRRVLGSHAQLVRMLRGSGRKRGLHLAVLDPQGQVPDPAALFHLGAVDYAGPALLREGLSSSRLRRVLAHAAGRSVPQPWAGAAAAVRSGPGAVGPEERTEGGWQGIAAGREYPFFIMFIELDGREEMEKLYDRHNLALACAFFQRLVSQAVAPYDGQVWIWSQFGGLVLFPLGEQPGRCIECGFRLVLFRELHDTDGSFFRGPISFRVVLHVGRLVYRMEDKGQVVSDPLNTIFHLGQDFAEAGQCYLTEEALSFIHPGLRDLIVPAGRYEERNIFRMKTPRH